MFILCQLEAEKTSSEGKLCKPTVYGLRRLKAPLSNCLIINVSAKGHVLACKTRPFTV